jgi:lysine biosynthesis protein LysW
MQCPDCGYDIDVSGCEVGEIVSCSHCGADFELGLDHLIDLDIEGEDFGE